MGIFDALNTSVAGLQAQSFALQNISGNIANAQTTGYKGIGTSFVDLVPDSTTPNRQVAGSVTAYARSTISSQGTVSASTVATYMAINGDGFFSVQKASGVTDNVPVFTGVTNYTRRGDFQVNANGNLVNGAGYYLMGVTVDPKTGNPLGNVPQVLQFQNNFVPAQATTAIQYAANLPTTPSTPASSTAPAGTLLAAGGLNPSDFSQNPLPVGTPPIPFGDATVTGSAALNKAATPAPITAATTLSGASPSDSLTTNFAVGDTIVVDGKRLNPWNLFSSRPRRLAPCCRRHRMNPPAVHRPERLPFPIPQKASWSPCREQPAAVRASWHHQVVHVAGNSRHYD
jgi:flagellar hook protein FlgE